MNTNVAERKRFVDRLEDFLQETGDKLKTVTNSLGWSEEFFTSNSTTEDGTKKKIACKFNPNHVISQEKLSSHEERCSWIADGYSHDEHKEATPSSSFFYENSKSVFSLTLDKCMQDEILHKLGKPENEISEKAVPRTQNGAISEFTPSERLAIYNYVVGKSKDYVNREDISIEDLQDNRNINKNDKESGNQKSRLQILAEQRDYKRRRQSYRAKNVHITKRSYTEVMREVIATQVSSWEQYLQDMEEEKKANTDLQTHSLGDDSDKKHSKCHRVSPLRHRYSPSRSRDRVKRSLSQESSKRSKKRRRSRSKSVERHRRRYNDHSSSSELSRSSESESDKFSHSKYKDHRKDRYSCEEKSKKHKKKKKHKKSSKRKK